jgi:hypothetical protein
LIETVIALSVDTWLILLSIIQTVLDSQFLLVNSIFEIDRSTVEIVKDTGIVRLGWRKNKLQSCGLCTYLSWRRRWRRSCQQDLGYRFRALSIASRVWRDRGPDLCNHLWNQSLICNQRGLVVSLSTRSLSLLCHRHQYHSLTISFLILFIN